LLVQKRSNFAKHAPYLVLASVMFLLCTMVRPSVVVVFGDSDLETSSRFSEACWPEFSSGH
jgi:hypothetical protein